LEEINLKLKALNGFKDILPDEAMLWRQVEDCAREVFARFCFEEIRLPILEKTELFSRSIGETTDIVEKEMYTFVEKQITMRPEATASLLRAYIEHGMYVQKPVQRLFTIGPMFRHERPQHGRLRQFHQMDAEVIGSANARVDAELIAMGSVMLTELGLCLSLELNSLGCQECRPGFRSALLSFLESRQSLLCDDCKRRSVTNPLRVLDCKNPECRRIVDDAPSIQEHLCSECATHFSGVQAGLQQLGIVYNLNRFMVRGLDYYCRTTFEFITMDLGSQSAVCAGGRYDNLIKQLGGPRMPGIGFAMGMERLILLLSRKKEGLHYADKADLFIAGLGEVASHKAFSLVHALRKKGARVAMDLDNRGLKSQMKQADKAAARYVLIIGDAELAKETGVLRDMETQEQREIPLGNAGIQTLMDIVAQTN
jgi:histidyl-tRNA synthetase